MSGKQITPWVMLVAGTMFEWSLAAAIVIDNPFWAYMFMCLSLSAVVVFEGMRLYDWVLYDAD
jgi:hypothetical protein